MPEDASLDDFLADTAGSADESAGSDHEGQAGDGTDPAEQDETRPDDGATDRTGATRDRSADSDGASAEARPVVTADWSPAGADCAVCGATVGRRWRSDEGQVCADCKEW